MSLDNLSVDELATHCREETAKYRRQCDNDPRFCFELFRLAFSQNDDEAFTALYRIYLPLVFYWVNRHPSFQSGSDLPEDFASDAVQRFYFAMRQGDFGRFENLPSVLQFLKRCVHTAVMYPRRKQPVTIPLATVPNLPSGHNAEYYFQAAEIWTLVEELLPEQNDRLLARLAYIQGLKPRDIVEMYPAIWETTEAVRVSRHRIGRRLQRNPRLRRYLGIDS
jgi:hypothetical protein